eukprot:954678_1
MRSSQSSRVRDIEFDEILNGLDSVIQKPSENDIRKREKIDRLRKQRAEHLRQFVDSLEGKLSEFCADDQHNSMSIGPVSTQNEVDVIKELSTKFKLTYHKSDSDEIGHSGRVYVLYKSGHVPTDVEEDREIKEREKMHRKRRRSSKGARPRKTTSPPSTDHEDMFTIPSKSFWPRDELDAIPQKLESNRAEKRRKIEQINPAKPDIQHVILDSDIPNDLSNSVSSKSDVH